MNFSIKNRLIGGFAPIILIFSAVVWYSISNISDVGKATSRVVDLRVPTSAASSDLVNAINASLASLRGWVISGKSVFKVERKAAWADIVRLSQDMDRLSASWTVPENIEKWKKFKTILAKFKTAQLIVENIAHSGDEQQATKILIEEAVPRAEIISTKITEMIDAEANLEATPQRKALLGMMADVRGTMGLSLANIRALLLTGNPIFQDRFDVQWAKNEQRFNDLTRNRSLLTNEQQIAFNELTAKRAEFAPLPAQMFDIRMNEKWNMVSFLLMDQAAPLAGELLDIIAGPKNVDGTRSGGMVDNQKKLLAEDVAVVDQLISDLKTMEIIALNISLLVAVLIVSFTVRTIVTPIKSIVLAMNELSQGKFDTKVPAQDRTDEIGEMASTVQVMKEFNIENLRLKNEALRVWSQDKNPC